MSFINNFKKVVYYLSPWLGDYDEDNGSCTLYNVQNNKVIHNTIKLGLSKITRSFQYIILNPKEDKTNGEVVFAVSDEHISVAEIAKLTVKHIGGQVAFVDWPQGRKNIDIGDAIISNKKIKSILNWFPQVNLVNGLGLTKEYYQTCLDKYFP